MASLMLFIVIFIAIVPVALFVLQYFLCKKESNFAIILPLIVACFFVLMGLYAIICSAILFGIYFVMRYLKTEKQKQISEIDKMNIQDLD